MFHPSNARIILRTFAGTAALAFVIACNPFAGHVLAADPAADKDARPSTATMDKIIKGMWTSVKSGWEDRLVQDATQITCSQYRNDPPAAEANAIVERETATIVMPADAPRTNQWQGNDRLRWCAGWCGG